MWPCIVTRDRASWHVTVHRDSWPCIVTRDRASWHVTVHRDMWPCIVTNFFLVKPTDALISQIYFYQETLHVSGSSFAHSSRVFPLYIRHWYMSCKFDESFQAWPLVVLESCHQTCMIYTSAECTVEKHLMNGQRNCPKHVEFLDKNKFVKLVRLLVRGELSYLAPLGSENISAPYFKQCFFRGGAVLPPQDRNNKYFILYIEFCINNKI